MQSKKIFLITLILLLLPIFASARELMFAEGKDTTVADPEISKAYYGALSGDPQIFHISAKDPFDLYIAISVPDILGQKQDVSAVIIKDGEEARPVAVLNGMEFSWFRYWDEFGRDYYFHGPEYKANIGAGEYEIRVWSSANDSKYTIVIGDKGGFTLANLSEFQVAPQIKKEFFNESPISFIISPFGFGYILVLYALAFILGIILIYLFKEKKTLSLSEHKIESYGLAEIYKNLGKKDRWSRALISIALLLIVIFTTWNPIIIFLSGYSLFESMIGWSVIYAAIGKNTYLLKS